MDAPIFYLTTPAALVNEALDMLGEPGQIIGAITDGTPVAETARRNYGQALRRLLRASYWNFCRKRAKLQLLGDALSGAALPVGVSAYVEPPWAYAYALPPDCVMARWVPWSPVSAQPTDAQGVPLTTGVSASVCYDQSPAPFLVASSDRYPIEVGSPAWDQLPDLQRTFGLGPTSREVILTNVCDGHLVYTAFEPVIERWDSLFRQALVQMMAIVLVNVAVKDPKMRIAERDRLSASLKITVDNARLASANEAGFPQSLDTTPDWIRARNSVGYGGGAFPGPGGYLYGSGGFGGGYNLFGWSTFSWGGSTF